MPKIVTLPGDGIGPEVLAAALRVLDAGRARPHLRGARVRRREHRRPRHRAHRRGARGLHGARTPCCSAAVGGPKWDTTDPSAPRPEQGLLGLRKGLGLYANLRPVRPIEALYDASPLRREIIEGTDLLVVRELTGGIYFGDKGRDGRHAPTTSACTAASEIERIARIGFKRRALARDAASTRPTCSRPAGCGARSSAACTPRSSPTSSSSTCSSTTPPCSSSPRPRHFDVILTENMFGDILSDEAAMLTGSIGMLPSASLGEPGRARRVRARPRLGARHRGPGDRQPARDDPVRGDDAPARTRPGGRRRLP